MNPAAEVEMFDELAQVLWIFGGLSSENERHVRFLRGQSGESADEKIIVFVSTKVGHGQNIALGYPQAAQELGRLASRFGRELRRDSERYDLDAGWIESQHRFHVSARVLGVCDDVSRSGTDEPGPRFEESVLESSASYCEE